MVKNTKKKEIFSVICNPGFEDLVSLEIKRILGVDSKKGNSFVSFESSYEQALLFAYLSQSSKKILKKISNYSAKNHNEIIEKSKENVYSFDGSFCVRSSIHSLEKDLGAVVHSKIENPSVDLVNPKNSIYFHVHETSGNFDVLCGFDLTNSDLSKRTYKIFSHPSSIKGTLAYYMVLLSGYAGKGMILDPCSGSCTIPIEAAYLATGFSLRYYDKDDLLQQCYRESAGNNDMIDNIKSMLDEYDNKVLTGLKKNKISKKTKIVSYDVDLQAVNSAKKNTKIGGVDKHISIARGDIDWLETKFEESSVDFIVSNPPHYSKTNIKKNDKFFDKFFYQTEYVLSKKGKITLLTNSNRIIDIAKKYKLISKIERRFNQGSFEHSIISFVKD